MIVVLNKAEGQIALHTMPVNGMTVIVRDYDIVPDNFHADDVEFDEEGRAYVPITWGPTA